MAKGNGSWLGRAVKVVDRDPECDRFLDLFMKEKGLDRESDLAALAGLNPSTIRNLFSKTKRPQHLTLAKCAAAMGREYGLTAKKAVDYEAEIPKAREEYKAYKASIRKERERKPKRRS